LLFQSGAGTEGLTSFGSRPADSALHCAKRAADTSFDLEMRGGPRENVSDDPAHDEIAAVIRATASLVTNEPNIVGFDFVFLRDAFKDGGRAIFGEGESAGPPGQDRAIRAAEAAIANLKRKLSQT
jgi:hypothetical protein